MWNNDVNKKKGVMSMLTFIHLLSNLAIFPLFIDSAYNDPTNYFEYFSLVPLFDASHMLLCYFVICGGGWLGLEKVLK